VVKRTSLNLDLELVARARDVLGTNGTTDTVHRALDEIVKRRLREQLAAHVFDMDNDEIERSELEE